MDVNLTDYETVGFWLSRLGESTRNLAVFHLERWLTWVNLDKGKFASMNPDELVEYQKNVGNGEKFEILDLLQKYVGTQKGTHSYKKTMYAYVRSFFMHNRVELPRDRGFKIRADKPQIVGELEPEEIRDTILSSKPVYQAAFLCILQGGMGQEEFTYWSETGWDSLSTQLKKGLDILKIDLPGRKMNKNKRKYFTFIGSDAVQALKNWLPYRPEGAEAIFTDQYGKPLSKGAMREYWLNHLRKVGVVGPKTKGSGLGFRTGKGLHELRESFRSLWEKSPAKASVAEFVMGYVVDPLFYNKAFRDEKWVRGEYKKALPMLQIMSSGRPFGQIEEDELESLRAEMARLRAGKDTEVEALEDRVKDMEATIFRERKVIGEEKESIKELLKTLIVRVEKLEEKDREKAKST